MVTKNGLTSFPVDYQGNLMHYPDTQYVLHEGKSATIQPMWMPNKPFEAKLLLQTLQRGRSAAYFIWVDTSTNKTYPMFMIDMIDVMQRKTVVKGVAIGTWQVRKRGQNYGIALSPSDF